MDLYSLVIYISMLALSTIFAAIAQKRNSQLLFLVSCLIVVSIFGLRNGSVGIDTHTYINNFNWGYKYPGEPGFTLLNSLLHGFGSQSLLIIIGSISYGLIYLRLWEMRNKISLSMAVFVLLCLFFPWSITVMRQFLSIAIVFFASRYLFSSRPLPFLIAIGIATTIHLTSIIAASMVFVLYLWKIKPGYKAKTVLTFFTLLLPLVAIGLLIIAFKSGRIELYSSYFTGKDLSFGIRYPLELAIVLLILLLFTGEQKKAKVRIDSNEKSIALFTILGLSLENLGYFFKFMGRAGLVFEIFLIVLFGLACNKKTPNSSIRIGITFAFSLFVFLNEIFGNGQGLMPYLFFWK